MFLLLLLTSELSHHRKTDVTEALLYCICYTAEVQNFSQRTKYKDKYAVRPLFSLSLSPSLSLSLFYCTTIPFPLTKRAPFSLLRTDQASPGEDETWEARKEPVFPNWSFKEKTTWEVNFLKESRTREQGTPQLQSTLDVRKECRYKKNSR